MGHALSDTHTNRHWRPAAARAAALAASAALACAIVIAWSDGIRQNIGPVLISARDWWRSAAAALALYVISLLLARRDGVSRPWTGVLTTVEKGSAMVAAGAAVAVLAFGLAFGALAACSPVSLGYVSQA